MPFRIVINPGIDACVFTTSRTEKVLKLPQTKRVKSITGTLDIHNENSNMFKTVSESSMKSMREQSRSNINGSPLFEENMTRLSGLRYYSPKVNHLPLIKKKTAYVDINEKPIEIDSEEDIERSEVSLIKQIGYWSILECEGNMPKSCESVQLLVIDYLVIVCGGQSQIKHCDVKILDLKTRRWRGITDIHGPKGRLGHSVVSYKHKLILFGGWIISSTMERHASSKLFYLSLKKSKWEKCFGDPLAPTPRKYHAAAQLGKNMLIYGGLDYTSELKQDLYVLDIKERRWSIPEATYLSNPGPRSHCTLTPVFHQTLKLIYNYSFDKIPRLKDQYSLPNSGFYLFGGLNSEKSPCNSLHALFIRSGKLLWADINSSGIPPSPRYSHSAHAIHSSLFIYGGRNDFISSQSQVALNDLFVFNVMNNKWDRVEVFGSVPEGRWAHGMGSCNTSLIVFGGISYHKFMPANLYLIETERMEAERRIRADIKKTLNN